jgi:hypothetical protein
MKRKCEIKEEKVTRNKYGKPRTIVEHLLPRNPSAEILEVDPGFQDEESGASDSCNKLNLWLKRHLSRY